MLRSSGEGLRQSLIGSYFQHGYKRVRHAKNQAQRQTIAETDAAPQPLPAAPKQRLAPDDQVIASNQTLHELFQQQTTAMLESADLSDEQKQSILVAMSCPCCGAGGFSFTAKLRRK